MARKPRPVETEHILFDILYEDGARTSNRKVPAPDAEGGEDSIRAFIEAQDRKIAEMSGHPRGPIKSIVRSGGR